MLSPDDHKLLSETEGGKGEYDLTAKATSIVERALVLDRQTGGSHRQNPLYGATRQGAPHDGSLT